MLAVRLQLWSGPVFRTMQTAVIVTGNGRGLEKLRAATKFIYAGKISGAGMVQRSCRRSIASLAWPGASISLMFLVTDYF
jgi:hypothetical protein